jgi:exodeoxyribonuclease VII large subunit
MSDDKTYSDTGVSKTNLVEYSVTELSGSLKRTVEERFGRVRVRGEISGYRGPHSSGHSYFSLKDERSRIEAVIWKGQASRLKHLPEEGLEVIASGKLTTYPGASKYQIVIDNLEPAGAGALMALLAERKAKLEAEGLFAPERKQLLPYMPRKIGVVTSPTGAVIRDVLHRISDRFPLHVLVWPVRVQGETTGSEVSRAIRGFNEMDDAPDLIIIARGGGSIEDLWGFNDEAIVRAAATSDIPLISAVGHETDWTLIDLAADVRAPTPTGAAELAVPVKAELDATVAAFKARLQSALGRQFDSARSSLRAAERGLSSPDAMLEMPRRRLDEATGRLGRGLDLATKRKRSSYESVAGRLSHRGLELAIGRNGDRLDALSRRAATAQKSRLERATTRLDGISRRLVVSQRGQLSSIRNRIDEHAKRSEKALSAYMTGHSNRLDQASRLLKSYHYEGVLDRGFAIVRNAKDDPVTSATSVKPGDAFTVQLRDGRISGVAAASQSGPSESPKAKPSAKNTKPADNGKQGSLF